MATDAKIEEWRQIEGFEAFSVSSFGRVKRCAHPIANGRIRIAAIVTPRYSTRPHSKTSREHSGYYRLTSLDHKVRFIAGCDLVAKAFLGFDPEQHLLGFRSGSSRNCRLSNIYLMPLHSPQRQPQVRRTIAERLAQSQGAAS